MSEAFDHLDLHHWLDGLTPAQAGHLRLVISRDDELPEVGAATVIEEEAGLPDGFAALFGSIDAPVDYAEQHDEYVRQRMERHPGRPE